MPSFKNVLLQKAKDGIVLLKMASWLLSQEQIKLLQKNVLKRTKVPFGHAVLQLFKEIELLGLYKLVWTRVWKTDHLCSDTH